MALLNVCTYRAFWRNVQGFFAEYIGLFCRTYRALLQIAYESVLWLFYMECVHIGLFCGSYRALLRNL